jgi:hypothetical protein
MSDPLSNSFRNLAQVAGMNAMRKEMENLSREELLELVNGYNFLAQIYIRNVPYAVVTMLREIVNKGPLDREEDSHIIDLNKAVAFAEKLRELSQIVYDSVKSKAKHN